MAVQRLSPGKVFGLEALSGPRASGKPRKRAATAVVSRGANEGPFGDSHQRSEAVVARIDLVAPNEEGGVTVAAGLPR